MMMITLLILIFSRKMLSSIEMRLRDLKEKYLTSSLFLSLRSVAERSELLLLRNTRR
jgi:hypothetical protein